MADERTHADDDDLACTEVVEIMTDYLEGALPPEEANWSSVTLKTCPGCTEYVAQMRPRSRAGSAASMRRSDPRRAARPAAHRLRGRNPPRSVTPGPAACNSGVKMAHNDTHTPSPPPRATSREWIGLAVIALPGPLYAMDLTVLTLAIPALSADLKPSSTELLWIVDVYGFLVAGFLITMGTLGYCIGRRRLLLIGAAAFGGASVGGGVLVERRRCSSRRARCSASPGRRSRPRRCRDPQHVPRRPPAHGRDRHLDHELLGRRGHRPAGRRRPARELPLGLGLPARRAGDGAAPGDRPAAAARVQGPRARAGSTSRARRSRCVAVLAVIYGIKAIAKDGFDASRAWRPSLAGLALGAAFVDRQRRLAEPMIDLGLFRRPRVQPGAEREHPRLRGRLRHRGLRRPVLPARARLLAARGGAVERARRGRVRGRLAADAAARGAGPAAGRDARRDRRRDRRRRAAHPGRRGRRPGPRSSPAS